VNQILLAFDALSLSGKFPTIWRQYNPSNRSELLVQKHRITSHNTRILHT
jgi:hypothetical protein